MFLITFVTVSQLLYVTVHYHSTLSLTYFLSLQKSKGKKIQDQIFRQGPFSIKLKIMLASFEVLGIF